MKCLQIVCRPRIQFQEDGMKESTRASKQQSVESHLIKGEATKQCRNVRQNDSRSLSALIQYADAIIFVEPQKISIIFHYYHRHHHHHHYNFCVSKYFRFGYCWKLRQRKKADISHHKSRLVCSNAPRLLCETHYTRN